MFKHILVPTDGSDISREACEHALDLAREHKAQVTVLMASPTYRRVADEGFILPEINVEKRDWEASVKERANAVLDEAAAKAKAKGVKCATAHVFKDVPHAAIIDAAKKNNADLIVMASHGHGGFKQWVLGSETNGVLSQSKIPVLVYR